MSSVITSAQNPLVKQIRRLRESKHRRREGLFVAEGIRPVISAVENGWPVETLVVAPELLTSEVGRVLVAARQKQRQPVAYVSPDLFRRIAAREHPAGLAAVLAERWSHLDALNVPERAILVALEAPANPGNLGTILRTLDAAGGLGLVLLGKGTDPFHPGAVRASMGALFSVPVISLEETPALLAWAQRHRFYTVATSASAAQDLWSVPMPERSLLLLGAERTGLDSTVLSAVDNVARIPMRGEASSLNVAVAAGIFLFEYRRRYP